MTSQEIQNQALQPPLKERLHLMQRILASIQQETELSDRSQAGKMVFPEIEYRTGSSGEASAVIKNTRIRVQTLVTAAEQWRWETGKIAEEYDLSEMQVSEALKFYELHKVEIEAAIASEVAFEAANV